MKENGVFIEILRQNWNHMRQQETLRMWIGNVFMAIIIATSAYLGQVVSSRQQDLTTIPIFVPIVILVFSFLCLGVTLKANHVFVETKESTKNIFKDKKIDLGNEVDWHRYVGMLESTSKRGKILKIRQIYVFMYIITIIASSAWLGILLIKG